MIPGLLAQSEAPENLALYILDRYGLPIAFLGLVLWIGRYLYERRVQELYRERDARDSLEATVRQDVVPALLKATEAIERMVHLAERLERRLDADRERR